MNILVISQYFFPEEFRINEICLELINRGHSVDVITGLPNYPSGKIYKGYRFKKRNEIYNGINIHRTEIIPRGKNSISLFLNYVSFMINSSFKLNNIKNKIDIVFVFQPSPVFQIRPAIKAGKKFGCKVVVYCCDQWPESIKARGINKGLIYDIVARYSKKMYSKVDYIINSSPSFTEYNHKINNVPLEKMSYLIQHAEDRYSNIDLTKEENGYVDLLFAGNVGKVQNVQDIINAYDILKYEKLRIHIVGNGSDYENCKLLISKKGLERNIIMYGRQPVESMQKFYKMCDACLLTLSGNSEIGNSIPSKLTGYLSAGKTIISAIIGDSRKIIDESKCGIYTDPDDVIKLSMVINEYIKNKEKYDCLGKNGRDYFIDNCTLNVFIDKLETILREQMKDGK